MITISVDWTTFTGLVSSKNLLVQYLEYPTSYRVLAIEDRSISWETGLSKDGGGDVTDFETNYKPTANAGLGGQAISLTATLSNVSASASSVSLLSNNPLRKMGMIFNDSSSILFVKFGSIASSSSYTVQMAANSYYEFPKPIYIGQIDGIWVSATGTARITELT